MISFVCSSAVVSFVSCFPVSTCLVVSRLLYYGASSYIPPLSGSNMYTLVIAVFNISRFAPEEGLLRGILRKLIHWLIYYIILYYIILYYIILYYIISYYIILYCSRVHTITVLNKHFNPSITTTLVIIKSPFRIFQF